MSWDFTFCKVFYINKTNKRERIIFWSDCMSDTIFMIQWFLFVTKDKIWYLKNKPIWYNYIY